MNCANCGTEAVVKRGHHNYKESGLDNVVLHGIELITCEYCGTVDPMLHRVQEIHEMIARAIVKKDQRLRGQEIRFLRKFLGLTAEKFGAILGTDKTRISKWENDADRPSDQMDRFIRTIAMHLGEGLNKNAGDIVRSFPSIADEPGTGRYENAADNSEVTYVH